MRVRLLVLCVLTMSLCQLSLAAEDEKGAKNKLGKRDPEAMFAKLDADGNKKISKDEFKKGLESFGKGKTEGKGDKISDMLFEKLDTDKDAYLTLDEFKKMTELREGAKGKLDPEKKKELMEKLKNKKQDKDS